MSALKRCGSYLTVSERCVDARHSSYARPMGVTEQSTPLMVMTRSPGRRSKVEGGAGGVGAPEDPPPPALPVWVLPGSTISPIKSLAEHSYPPMRLKGSEAFRSLRVTVTTRSTDFAERFM